MAIRWSSRKYVPEQWSIYHGTVVYLEINRELRSFRDGRQEVLSRDPRIEKFDHFGNAVLYTSQLGTIKVAWTGKALEY
jgi:hypothetical protein